MIGTWIFTALGAVALSEDVSNTLTAQPAVQQSQETLGGIPKAAGADNAVPTATAQEDGPPTIADAISLLPFDASAAKAAVTEFWQELNSEAREFTRRITPSMEAFAGRMEQAGFPAPLVHGFREIEVPTASLLPSFVPNIPSMGPFNPATWSQEQIDAALNPPGIFNAIAHPNTVTEIPGVGRFSLAVPPVPWELGSGILNQNGGILNTGITPSIPSFIRYERIPGPPPSYLNFPELGVLNPANAYAGYKAPPPSAPGPIINALTHPFGNGSGPIAQAQQAWNAHQDANNRGEGERQLSIATDLLQNGIDRISDIVNGATGGSGVGSGILGQTVIDPVLNLVRRGENNNGQLSGGLLSGLLDRTQRIVQN